MLARCTAQRREDLALHHFADGTVVYDEANGGIHALSSVAGLVLTEILAHESLSTLALAACLELDDPGPQELVQLVTMVRELELLGFVDCSSA